MLKSIDDWNSGVIIESKLQEDIFMKNCSVHFSLNCCKNPGKIAERSVKKRLEDLEIKCKTNEKFKCDWLTQQKTLNPDITTEKFVVEVKSMRYYNGKGKRGNQGTGSEKIDSVFRKYAGMYDIYGKKTIIVLCGDMQYDKNSKSFLDAFRTINYSNNKAIVALKKTFQNEIFVIKYQELTKEFIDKINK
jgi:hypothetical protein